MDKSKNNEWVTHLMLLIVTINWGFNIIAMKLGFEHLTPIEFNALRLICGLPFMVYFGFFTPKRVKFERKDLLKIIGLSIIGLGFFQVLFPIGIHETSAPVGGVLMATAPVHVAFLSSLFKLEKPTLRMVAGIGFTVVGIALIGFTTNTGDVIGNTTIRGVLFVVISELGYAVNTTFLKPFMKKYPSMQITGVAMTVCTVLYVMLFFPQIRVMNISTISFTAWWTALYSGLIAFMLCNVIWHMAVHRIGSVRVSVYGNMPSVFVIILSAIFLGQVLLLVEAVGTLIILAGVVLVQLKSRRKLPQDNLKPTESDG